ncbi:hypothetical protein EDD11_002388 [Mortierella claussenii]|nr:hypothetical protein EDD11_002388 [Mortierella claussenii]
MEKEVCSQVFKDDKVFMEEDLDYQLIKMDKSADGEQFSQFDPSHQQFLGQQGFQNIQMAMLPSDQLTSASMSYASSAPMDFSAGESSSSGYSGSSSKSVTPVDSRGFDDGQQSRRSSQDVDELKSARSMDAFSPGQDPQLGAASNGFSSSMQQYQMNDAYMALTAPQPQSSQSFPPYSNGLSVISGASSDTGEAGDVGEDPAIKRAEQNRAAQRAFRQRKQQYIRWLESKAEELDEVYRIMALVRTENQQLRKLVMELDVSLTESRKGGSAALSANASNVANSALEGLPGLRFDQSISREVSTRLMNLSSFPGLGLYGEKERGVIGRPKYQPRSMSDGKGPRIKGNAAYKLNQLKQQQQQREHMALMQNQHVLQLQEQQHEKHLQRQNHQQQPMATTLDNFAFEGAPAKFSNNII